MFDEKSGAGAGQHIDSSMERLAILLLADRKEDGLELPALIIGRWATKAVRGDRIPSPALIVKQLLPSPSIMLIIDSYIALLFFFYR